VENATKKIYHEHMRKFWVTLFWIGISLIIFHIALVIWVVAEDLSSIAPPGMFAILLIYIPLVSGAILAFVGAIGWIIIKQRKS
jgi:hypothetical protein